jgi:hypothetical protein
MTLTSLGTQLGTSEIRPIVFAISIMSTLTILFRDRGCLSFDPFGLLRFFGCWPAGSAAAARAAAGAA